MLPLDFSDVRLFYLELAVLYYFLCSCKLLVWDRPLSMIMFGECSGFKHVLRCSTIKSQRHSLSSTWSTCYSRFAIGFWHSSTLLVHRGSTKDEDIVKSDMSRTNRKHRPTIIYQHLPRFSSLKSLLNGCNHQPTRLSATAHSMYIYIYVFRFQLV